MRSLCISAVVSAFGLTCSALAADYYWNPAVSSGAWADAANWCADAEGTTPATEYPNATTAVIHFTSDAEVALADAFSTGAFTVHTGASLTLTGTDATAHKVTFSGQVTLEADAVMTVRCARFVRATSSSNNITCNSGSKVFVDGGAYVECYTFKLTATGGTALLSLSGESTVYAAKSFNFGGGNSIVIDDSKLSTGHFYAGSTNPNGSVLFKGKKARHVLGNNQYYVCDTSNSRVDLNFSIPVGGYAAVPISQTKSTFAFGNPNKATYVNNSIVINVLDDSPAAFASEQVNQTLIAWPKGFDPLVSTGNLPYGTTGAAFDIVGETSTTNLTVTFTGSSERVAVTAEPVEAGVPTLDGAASTFGSISGIAAGSQHTFAFPAYTNLETGIAASARGWSAFKFDGATGDYTTPYGSGQGAVCAYTHPDPVEATKLVWDLDVGYHVTVTPTADGTTSFETTWMPHGELTLTATPDAAHGFYKWIVTDADQVEHISYEPTLRWQLDGPITCTPVYSSARWVTKDGSAEGTGAADAPFATLAQALAVAQPGDTIRFGAGTFEVADAVTLSDAKKIVGNGCTGADATILVPLTTATAGAFVLSGDGAGMSDLVISGAKVRSVIANAGAVVRNCVIRNSDPKWSGSGREGAAASASGGTIVDCVITNNRNTTTAIRYGGGVRIMNGGLVDRCVIADNDNGVSTHGENGGGGAYVGEGTLRNSLITGNAATKRGAGVFVNYGVVENCTIVANGSKSCLDDTACGVYLYGGTVRNCIIWDNVTASSDQMNLRQVAHPYTGNYVTYVDTTPLAEGEGNIDAVPSFVDAAARDYRLKFCAAVDAALPLAWHRTDTDLTRVTSRVSGEAADLGCYEYVSSGLNCSFLVDKTSGLAPLSVTATASVEGADDVEYRWYLTGGEEPDFVGSDKAQVSIDLPAGRYAARLVVADQSGNTAEFVLPGGLFAAPPVVYVDAANAGRSVFPYGLPETAATNLETAAEATVVGGEIRLSRGDYRLSATLILAEGQRLVAPDGPEVTVLLPPEDNPSFVDPLVQVQGAETRLAGVTLANARRSALLVKSGAMVTNCVVRGGESSADEGAAVKVEGGVVVCCVVSNNVATQTGNTGRSYGGGVKITGSGLVDRCIIAQNSASMGTYGKSGGGGVFIKSGTLRNSLVWGNTAAVGGTGVRMEGGRIENCTIVTNGLVTTTEDRAAGLYLDGEATGGAVVNCIIRDNFNGTGIHDAYLGSSAVIVTNTCAGVDLGPGNTTADPRFRNPSRGNWRLRNSSPLLDAGADADYTGDLATDVDLIGQPRKRGEAIGLGCFEGERLGLSLILR